MNSASIDGSADEFGMLLVCTSYLEHGARSKGRADDVGDALGGRNIGELRLTAGLTCGVRVCIAAVSTDTKAAIGRRQHVLTTRTGDCMFVPRRVRRRCGRADDGRGDSYNQECEHERKS